MLKLIDSLSHELVETCKLILKDAKRDYRSALKRIQRMETFLAKQLEGLGYDGERLYGADSFQYPPRIVASNGGLSRIVESSYMLSFTKDETGWHFWIAPTTESARSGTTIHSDESKRLVDAPAGMVLYCVERLDAEIVHILDLVASLICFSYRPGTHTSRRGKRTTKVQFDA